MKKKTTFLLTISVLVISQIVAGSGLAPVSQEIVNSGIAEPTRDFQPLVFSDSTSDYSIEVANITEDSFSDAYNQTGTINGAAYYDIIGTEFGNNFVFQVDVSGYETFNAKVNGTETDHVSSGTVFAFINNELRTFESSSYFGSAGINIGLPSGLSTVTFLYLNANLDGTYEYVSTTTIFRIKTESNATFDDFVFNELTFLPNFSDEGSNGVPLTFDSTFDTREDSAPSGSVVFTSNVEDKVFENDAEIPSTARINITGTIDSGGAIFLADNYEPNGDAANETERADSTLEVESGGTPVRLLSGRDKVQGLSFLVHDFGLTLIGSSEITVDTFNLDSNVGIVTFNPLGLIISDEGGYLQSDEISFLGDSPLGVNESRAYHALFGFSSQIYNIRVFPATIDYSTTTSTSRSNLQLIGFISLLIALPIFVKKLKTIKK